MTKQASLEHAVVRSTVRLLAGASALELSSVGTGFFYKVIDGPSNRGRVLIVTNKHVVRDAACVQFVVSGAPDALDLDEHHQPRGRRDQLVTWALNGVVYDHPDPLIDICAVDVTHPIGQCMDSMGQLRSVFLDSTWLGDEQDATNMRDIEQVLVVGYPRGIWDEHNNMPIARRGTSATHPRALYGGKREFLVDVAAFAGSSGSPVFAYESPMFRAADGAFSPGTKMQLIGVVWGVHEASIEGELRSVEIPSAARQVPVVTTSLSLAIAHHADALRDIDALVMQRIRLGR
jgi:hypothetical protein